MQAEQLKQRRRRDYAFFQAHQTRWSDNDQYLHMNNSIYYHLFDSIVNTYLIQHCALNPASSESIGLVVSSYCHFFAPLSFPQKLTLGLRVNSLGRSSVTYEVGVFTEDEDKPSAVGGYTHVFVDREDRKSRALNGQVKAGLQKLREECVHLDAKL